MTHILAERKHATMAEVLADHDAMPHDAREETIFEGAKCYVWGREDMGETRADESWGMAFAAAWLDAKRNFDAGKRYMLPNMREAYESFRDGKSF